MALPDQTELLEQAERYFARRPNAIGAGSQHIIESLPPLLRESGCLTNQTGCLCRVLVIKSMLFAWQKWGYDIVYYDALEELLTQHWAVAVVIQPNNPDR